MGLLISFCTLISLLTGCSFINQKFGLEDDNPIEETIEAVIKIETGANIDLTPGSPE